MKMSFLGIILLFFIAILVIAIYFIVKGIKQKNTKQILVTIACFVLFLIMVYIILDFFITSM